MNSTSQNSYSISEIINYLKERLFEMGYDTIRILGKIFREMKSYDGAYKINKDEFLTGLRDIGILLPKSAAEKLVQHFDKDIDGYVYFEDFLIEIRGIPNDNRQKIIDKAFLKFDKDNSGLIDVRDLKGVFNANKHSKVISGEITQEQAFDEFLKNFNDHTGAGKIDKFEWDDYYAAVSISVTNDEHFILLLKSVWGLD